MNLQWFTSPEWANIVKALLHTLWQGAVVAVLLGLALRRLDNPVARYRSSLAALAGVLLAGLVTWAILNRPMPVPISNAAAPVAAAVDEPVVQADMPPLVVHFSPAKSKQATLGWTAWLALVWLAGATVMIGRAGFQVAGAERLRRASQPYADAQIAELLAEARRAVGLARRVRLAVTDKLTSPAVVGVLVPTLILPLSLANTLSPEQIRFILLHELAHIRRGDYFANLFQLFAEALLFFNPAVWWLSHQMRIEREACCDALAIELSGAPADYARTLLHVAENVLSPLPQAAPAFGDKREPSSLADRVQRLLVPGYRPRLRLTWRAMLAALCVGGTLLMLSAIGTRVTVAAILSPQQRIDRIEKKMTELGERPEVVEFSGDPEKAPQVLVTGIIRTPDGSPVPKWVQVNVNSTINRSSYGTAVMARNGLFTNSIRAGNITLSADVPNYAPAIAGPLDGLYTNTAFYVTIDLERGFDVPLQILDADSGKLLPGASVSTMFWINSSGFQSHAWKSGADGVLTLTHCADLPMDATVNVPGYEILKKRIDHLHAGEPVVVKLQPGKVVSGTVLDKATGQPLAGAELRLLYQAKGEGAGYYGWDNSLFNLGQSDASGAFSLNQLRGGVRYYLGVSAPGHESVILPNIIAGTNLVVRLGPELIVRGHVNGNLEQLQQINQDRALDLNWSEVYENNSYGSSQWVPLHIENGVATFQFTNRAAGMVTLSGRNGYQEEREITAPVADWVINLKEQDKTEPEEMPKREVVFRFKHASGVPPRGTVQVEIPDNLDINHLTSHYETREFTNGEVHARIAIGGRTSIEPKHMVGYWFNRAGINGNLLSLPVTSGAGPMIVDIPLIPAGAIYAKARNAGGAPAGGLFFGVTELKRAPGRDLNSLDSGSGDGFSDNSPRQWVSGPLPLGGKYQIHAWRGNAFCVSEPVKLTEANPDAEVELQFAPGKKFMGQVLDADGKPLRDAELKPLFKLAENKSFGLTSLYSNERGWFEMENATPELGEYSVEVNAPGAMTERVTLNFNAQPQTIRLKRAHTLAGRVVEAGTGYPIPGAEVRALDYDRNQLPMVTTHTDADGRFEFNTLGDVQYTLYTEDGERKSDQKYRADGNTNVELRIKLYGWSKVKPKTPTASADAPSTAMVSRSTGEARSSDGAGANTNVPQILMQAHLYQMAAGDFEKAAATWKFKRLTDSGNPYWVVPAGEVDAVNGQLGKRPSHRISSPRLVTVNGEAGQIYIGNEDSSQMLSCRPVITGDAVDVTLHGMVVSSEAGAHVTNQFDIKNTVESRGSLATRIENYGGHAESNLVALIYFEVITNASARFQPRLQKIIKPATGTNVDPAMLFTRTYKVDKKVFYSALKQNIGSDFRASGGAGAATNSAAMISEMARKFITSLGVNLDSPAGKAVFFNDEYGGRGGDGGSGMLFAKATLADQDLIDRAIQTLNQVPPQIHIKARFLEVPKGTVAGLGSSLNATNSITNQLTGIIKDAQLRAILSSFASGKGIETLAEPEITTMSGRQCQMRATQVITVITNFTYQETIATNGNGTGAISPQLMQFETGPMLDVIPYVLSDGYTINLAVIPTLAEFQGYDTGPDVPNVTGANNRVQLPFVLPRFSTRQMVATVNMRDGDTMVIGGMPQINSHTHKTPVLGSVPLFGRLFKSENTTTNEMLVFITANIVDPSGNRVHGDAESSHFQIKAAPDTFPTGSRGGRTE